MRERLSAKRADGWWDAGRGEEGLGIDAAAGDLTGDGYPDLVVQGYGYDEVTVILGSGQGLAPGTRTWAVPSAEYTALQALPLSGGSHAWLVAQNWDPSGPGAGAVSVLRGNADGSAGPVSVWSQDSPGVKGAAEPGDGFGWAIAGATWELG